MTDISSTGVTLPGRLGAAARLDGEELVLELFPQEETMHHGMIRASVLALLVDVVAGVPFDREADVWTLTSDMSVHMRPVPAPGRIDARGAVLRQGRRSATSLVELTTEAGAPIATGAIGFTKIPRKATDPPKPHLAVEQIVSVFTNTITLGRPLRDEAGIQVIDPGEGVVEVELTADLRNPAGTMQGAMVALVAEAAAEDLLAKRFGDLFVVTDLDLRYLRKTEAGPVRSRSRLLGERPDAPVQVELIDVSTGAVTTLVYARGVRL